MNSTQIPHLYPPPVKVLTHQIVIKCARNALLVVKQFLQPEKQALATAHPLYDILQSPLQPITHDTLAKNTVQ